MLLDVNVKAVGHGLGYNKYPVVFSFKMNVGENYADEEEELYLIGSRVTREAKKKTCCDQVTISSYSFDYNDRTITISRN